MISIRMIKPCGISIYKPLQTIFQNCLYSGKFPSERKKANVVPTFKKGDKQCIKNCRPVSLLPACGKGSSHSTYAQKLPKLDPPPPLIRNREHLAWHPFMRTYFLYILLYKKRKVLRFCGPKKLFVTYVCNLETLPLPRCTQSYVFSLKPPLPCPTPNCAYVLCGWPPKCLNGYFMTACFHVFQKMT